MSSLPHRLLFHQYAFFLDFDGTLAEFGVPKLHDPGLDSALFPALAHIQRESKGALAIVTGRDIPEVAVLLAPLKLAVSGSHGSQIRRAPDAQTQTMADTTGMERVYTILENWVTQNPGTRVTRKLFTTVLDLKQAPELTQTATHFIQALLAPYPALTLLHGIGSIEVKPAQTSKGTAVSQMLLESPFCNRIPIFVGDDVADESAFQTVNRHPRALSIKVGAGQTHARHRLENPKAVREWLYTLCCV